MAQAYVANIPGNAVYVINIQTNKVTGKLIVPLPFGIAVSPNSQVVYVTSQSSNRVWVFNARTRKLIRKILVGKSPQGIAVTPNGRLIWVANSGDNTVSVINAHTHKVIRTLPAGQTPSQLAVSPGGRYVYVSNSGSNSVSVFRTLTQRKIATIPVGSTPGHIAFTPGGTRAYVLNTGSNSISVIRTSTLKEISRFNIGSAGSREPYGIAVSTSGRNLLVTMFLDSLLSIAIPSNKIVRRIIFSDETTGAKAPLGIAVRRNRIYMVASANDQVEVRAAPSLKVVATIQVPHTLESEQGLQEIVIG